MRSSSRRALQSNAGSYSDPKADTLIKSTTMGNATLAAYENYLAQQLPVVWQPNPVTVFEVNKNLQQVTPINSLQTHQSRGLVLHEVDQKGHGAGREQ